MLQCLQTSEQPWIAGMIDGVPQTLRTKITIEFCFKKDALVR